MYYKDTWTLWDHRLCGGSYRPQDSMGVMFNLELLHTHVCEYIGRYVGR